jgi:hypothetical protein
MRIHMKAIKTFIEALRTEENAELINTVSNLYGTIFESEDDMTGTKLGEIPDASTSDEVRDISDAVDDVIQVEQSGAEDRERQKEELDRAVTAMNSTVSDAQAN